MTRTIITKLTVLAIVALLALISVQATAAKTLPSTKVSASAALARIQHPTGSTYLWQFEAFRGGPLGVYSVKRSDLQQVLKQYETFRGGPLGVYSVRRSIAIPPALSRIAHPGFVGAVSK
jgi:hypothetical protein